MTQPFILSLAISDGHVQGYVYLRLTDADMTLPFDEFCVRYLEPAFEQVKREMAYEVAKSTDA